MVYNILGIYIYNRLGYVAAPGCLQRHKRPRKRGGNECRSGGRERGQMIVSAVRQGGWGVWSGERPGEGTAALPRGENNIGHTGNS